jgi:hypothetical protein
MAKKHTRHVSKSVQNSTVVATASKRNHLSSTDFNPDYTFVKADLKRIGILAGSFIGVLVILTFFLR